MKMSPNMKLEDKPARRAEPIQIIRLPDGSRAANVSNLHNIVNYKGREFDLNTYWGIKEYMAATDDVQELDFGATNMNKQPEGSVKRSLPKKSATNLSDGPVEEMTSTEQKFAATSTPVSTQQSEADDRIDAEFGKNRQTRQMPVNEPPPPPPPPDLKPGDTLVRKFDVTSTCPNSHGGIPGVLAAGAPEDGTWTDQCNMHGPSYKDLAGAASQTNLLWVLIPILVVVLMLLFGACAVCMLLRRRRDDTIDGSRSTATSAPAQPPAPAPSTSGGTSTNQTKLIPAGMLPSALENKFGLGSHVQNMRPSTVAPFGNVVASNVPYVIQSQQIRPSVVSLPATTTTGGLGTRTEGSIVYVRPPYQLGRDFEDQHEPRSRI